MATVQEQEIQLAQKLASNEKPIRTKALKKLRKYINVRSQKATDGFTSEELLKLWKGLFYCLWMQDKPLLQEELSNSISGLIHNFHDLNGQFLYLECSLKTFKREWTGIDRLRMDKFFQFVRFMFRQSFEMLKRKNWDCSAVARFLELLATELLHVGSNAPTGLQLHVLDLYLTELAVVGSAELTADQNLVFIEPFCKTAAKTKDRTLFSAICNSIFSTIIDQAPFAIDDLMKELKATESSDSGQSSEGEEVVERKELVKQMNGSKSYSHDDDQELQSDDSDTELQYDDDDDTPPVLQFDYAAVADKLLQLSKRSNTPSLNRQRLYKIIKVLRDLSEGIFPQDEYPEEVSTDEDDDMFGSRKKMKKGRSIKGESGKKKSKPKQMEDSSKDGMEPIEPVMIKKQKRKKKKSCRDGCASGDLNARTSKVEHTEDPTQSKIDFSESADEATMQPSVSALDKPNCCITNKNQLKKKKKKKKKKRTVSELKLEERGEHPTCTTQEVGTGTAGQESSLKASLVSSSKTDTKLKSQSDTVEGLVNCGMSENNESEPQAKKPAKRKKRGLKVKELEGDSQLSKMQFLSIPRDNATDEGTVMKNDATPSTNKQKREELNADKAPSYESATKTELTILSEDVSQQPTAVCHKNKAKTNKQEPIMENTGHTTEEKTPELLLSTSQSPANASASTKKKRRRTRNKLKAAVQVEKEVTVSQLSSDRHMGTSMKKKNELPSAQVKDVQDETQFLLKCSADDEPIVGDEASSSSEKQSKKKKRKIPVVFEFEADELETATPVNSIANRAAGVQKISGLDGLCTPVVANKTPKSKVKTSSCDFVTFQAKGKVPTPLFYRAKRSPKNTQLGTKISQTPTMDSKKVTFHLKNNKTAEFRKTDRSLLLSPEGSSKVPFDPEQKPKSGVLKSSPKPLSTSIKKTPIANRKRGLSTPNSTPKKRRPSAADFF
ncbi:ribosomal RNA processing protein 1 homolog B-like [Dunckerocampus dactyliophorus]|uniref:ribosomal RNA processing protein 1 homolog B-like n=1 Tax=Dunckerocampus dactyliophorus TaxID=161453 RepID=UPI002405512B|nr:ribosomal RNA processing protein 1 homolog B-like [Dunckerocampus dactyliophorus]